ncbi:MAG: hypothetical protein V4689_17045 [Verrucomicrobiota bacterium]
MRHRLTRQGSTLIAITPLLAAFILSSCGRGGFSKKTEKRYELRQIEVGTSLVEGQPIATLLLHCAEGDFYLTSSDIRKPSEIINVFIWILPMAAAPKSSGHESCEVQIEYSQYHSRSMSDQSNPPQKNLWFRFKPHSKLSQQFSVDEFTPGTPTNFTCEFKQSMNAPLVFQDHHWIQTKPTRTW